MNKELEKAIFLILQEAKDRREGAGFAGRSDDGGASRLETQVRFYRLGAEGKMPEEWRGYLNQAIKESDPEYLEYLRLKGKFE